jgi:hypothetical protein
MKGGGDTSFGTNYLPLCGEWGNTLSQIEQDGTPYRIGELVKLFPKLNIAVISVHDFPVSRAPWFIWEGAKSYLSLW